MAGLSAARVVRATRRARALSVTSSGRRLGDAAAESGFFLALTILPMMLTTTALLRALRPLLGRDAGPGVKDGLSRLLRIVLSSRGGVAADAAGHLLSRTTGGLLTVGTLLSVFILTRAVRSLLTGLHAVHALDVRRTTRQHRRGWVDAAGLAILGLVLGAVILAMLVVGPLLGHAGQLSPTVAQVLQVIWGVARWPVGLGAIYVYLLLIHSVGLRERVTAQTARRNRRARWTGAALSTVGVVLASVLLPLYVHVAGSISSTLGALGGGLILLIWAYLLAYSILLGGRVCCELATRSGATEVG